MFDGRLLTLDALGRPPRPLRMILGESAPPADVSLLLVCYAFLCELDSTRCVLMTFFAVGSYRGIASLFCLCCCTVVLPGLKY